ncbi:MAG: glycosyltransferase [Deltaproteobacteria bacterium]|nr:glycosyltransferase [Deltaproteobacteria bacterium]
MTIELGGIVVGAGLLGAVLYTHLMLRRAVARRREQPVPGRAQYPSVTVIRPVRGLDEGAAENFAAALATGYPGEVETLFVFDEETDPALPVARAAIEAHRSGGHPGTARVIFVGTPPPGRTGKLNAMIRALEEARGELVAFGDSDTRPDREVLRVLADTLLSDERIGCTFAPVVVENPLRTAGAVGYATLLNGLYGPAVALTAGEQGSMPFIMGQLMLFRREALAGIGGLESVSGQLVDDMYIGTRVVQAGYRNVVTRHPLQIVDERMTLAEFLRTYRRWIIFSRSGLPFWSFNWPAWLRGIEFWLGLGLGFAAVVTGHPWAGAVLYAAALALGASIMRLHRAVGGAPIRLRHAWVPYALLLAAPFIYVATLLWPEVKWRGRRYGLDTHARLGPRGPATGGAAG